jgi:N6-L-threonylcarbamoyladenine synthase
MADRRADRLEIPAVGRVLGIETSCDETAVAVVDGDRIRSSVIRSQVEIHEAYGGVVPELAARAHDAAMLATLERALADAALTLGEIDAIAVTTGPGLPGALMVGIATAQGLSVATGIPMIGVDHMEGHLFAAALEGPVPLPALVLLVSGGHTELVAVDAPGAYRVLGRTRDDAAGEAFDKVARLLGLGYPGGPAIEEASEGVEPGGLSFPRGMPQEGLEFSFSGVKTAVARFVASHPEVPAGVIAAAFQQAAVDALVVKVGQALAGERFRSVAIGGGVAANSLLRARIGALADDAGVAARIPARRLCTDNGAMIAAAASFHLARGDAPSLVADPEPSRMLVDAPALHPESGSS